MKTPKELVSDMKAELKQLLGNRAVIDKRIAGLQAALESFDAFPKKAEEQRKLASTFDFRAAARKIFENNGNQPLSPKEIVDRLLDNGAPLTRQQLKSKIVYWRRPDAKALAKSEYGKYYLLEEASQN